MRSHRWMMKEWKSGHPLANHFITTTCNRLENRKKFSTVTSQTQFLLYFLFCFFVLQVKGDSRPIFTSVWRSNSLLWIRRYVRKYKCVGCLFGWADIISIIYIINISLLTKHYFRRCMRWALLFSLFQENFLF